MKLANDRRKTGTREVQMVGPGRQQQSSRPHSTLPPLQTGWLVYLFVVLVVTASKSNNLYVLSRRLFNDDKLH